MQQFVQVTASSLSFVELTLTKLLDTRYIGRKIPTFQTTTSIISQKGYRINSSCSIFGNISDTNMVLHLKFVCMSKTSFCLKVKTMSPIVIYACAPKFTTHRR